MTPIINEFLFNHTGTDTHEYIEIFGTANTDYSSLSLVLVEGDASASGEIDRAYTLGTTDGNGYWHTGFLSNQLENGTQTLLLVENFSGTVGNDLDTNNDGTLESTPWTTIVDEIAVSDGDSGDRTYASVILTPGFDGISFIPGAASRLPNGTDTDTASDWTRNDFHGEGLAGFTGTPAVGEALNTPGTKNLPVDVPPTVSIVSPANGATGVPANAPIQIEFSEPISAIGDWYNLSGTASGMVTATVSGSGQTFTLTPTSNFSPGETLTVTVNAGNVTDTDGTADALDGNGDGTGGDDFSFNFDVAPTVGPLVISEIMFDPDSPEPDWEWVELYNVSHAPVDLSGYVLDDDDGTPHTAANIASGTIPPNQAGILYNAGDVSAAEFEAAWGTGLNLIAVTGWGNMLLNNGGDKISLWPDFASYSGDDTTHNNALDTVDYGVGGFPDPVGRSIYLTNRLADNRVGNYWATSTDGGTTPVGIGNTSTATVNNSGNDIGSPREMAIAPIHQIQGNGNASPLVGDTVVIEGIVVGDFQGNTGLQGFFLQEEDTDADADLTTSEGIFLYDPTTLVDVSVGDKVRAIGEVAEFTSNGTTLTQLTNLANLTVVSNGNSLPTATSVTLPLANLTDWEPYEGMLVNVGSTSGNLTVTEHFNLDRFGQVTLSANGRLEQFTQNNSPDVAGYTAHLADIAKRHIILDDGSSQANPTPIIHARGGNPLTPTNPLRAGDTITNITGILDHRFGEYRVQTQTGQNFSASNPRPAVAPAVGGDIQVASLNLQNFFNGDGNGGGFPTARGAKTQADFIRQRDKIVAAITKLDADIIGLMELENDGYGANSAIQDLTDALNAVAGAGTYSFVNPGVGQIGSDEIAVGILYKPGVVSTTGTAAILNTPGIFAGSDSNRTPLAQTFTVADSTSPSYGEKFTIAVNHLKSKGGSGTGPNADADDGQGAWNQRRVEGVNAVTSWLSGDPTGSNDPDILTLGDFNAYAQEDPIQAIANSGYQNLIPNTSSFVFDGQWGSLDYAFANNSLHSQFVAGSKWHINADEPDALDYSSEFNHASLYAADEFRVSDHDPLVVGLSLNNAPILDNSSAINLPSIDEDTTNPAATSVATLINGKFSDTNPHQVSGIAVTAVDNTNGNWQYSLDGNSWTDLGNLGATTARLLNSNASIRFVPAADFNGNIAPGIRFRAWDGTAGNNGATADTSTNGKNTAFSTATATANIAIAPVNDAPTVANPINDFSATENSAFNVSFAANTFTDIDGDSLSYSAAIVGGSGLPSWLSFDAATRTFSGMPTAADVGEVAIAVTATDGAASVTDIFTLTVNPEDTDNSDNSGNIDNSDNSGDIDNSDNSG
ncbi:ExeM/NucH family extracellular endonuclease, partial [Phormidium sp. CCY1219]|uniref:ExeM/NucH family extracellular endonuclease n=1 Tax=Phormidium sp. CCY1219 TaxID=2886104 RepID=UPI002D1EA2E2